MYSKQLKRILFKLLNNTGYRVCRFVFSRRGRTSLPHNIVSTSPSSVKKARECSLGVKGAKMFNLIPVEIRNIDSNNVEAFKAALDTFLERVPDHWSGQ